MRRLAFSLLAVLAGVGAGIVVFQLVAPDDPDMTDEVVQVLTSNRERGRDVFSLAPDQAERWLGGEAPTRSQADQGYEVGNADLGPVVRRYEAEMAEAFPEQDPDEPRTDTTDDECRFWPVAEEGDSAEDVESVVKACYGSDAPRSRPDDLAQYGLDLD